MDSAHISKVFLTRIGMNANEFRNTYQMAGNICHIRDRREFYSLVSYIYRHYSENLKPKEVGDMFGMSPRELNRILQYQVEMDFSDFLILYGLTGPQSFFWRQTGPSWTSPWRWAIARKKPSPGTLSASVP